MLYHTALPSLYSTELPTHTGTLRGGSTLKRRLHQELAAASRSHRATVELSRRATLTAVVRSPTVAVTNLSLLLLLLLCLILILQLLPTLGLGGGRVLSCNSNLRVPCIGFESILRVYDLVKFSLSVLCRLVLPTTTVAPVLIDAQGNQTNQSSVVLFYLPHGSTGTDRCKGTKPRISSNRSPASIPPASEHVSGPVDNQF
jgi:hypothetical protein